jgi:hypothetical protein
VTFPAGKLPNAGQIAQAAAALPSASVVFTGGSTDLDLTNPTNGVAPCALDFVCTVAGVLTAQLALDSAPQSYPVAAGEILRGAWVLAKSTSTASGIFRGGV